jgi:hypothetical protein
LAYLKIEEVRERREKREEMGCIEYGRRENERR